jgi:hypothetical protein
MNCVPSSAGLKAEASNKETFTELQMVQSAAQGTGFT